MTPLALLLAVTPERSLAYEAGVGVAMLLPLVVLLVSALRKQRPGARRGRWYGRGMGS